MRNSVMSLIFKSLNVASASGRVAELFFRNRCGGTVVGVGLERRLVVNQVTGWMIDNVGQQRLRAAEQRVSTVRGQQSGATRAEAAQVGLTKAKTEVLAASSEKGVCERDGCKLVLQCVKHSAVRS